MPKEEYNDDMHKLIIDRLRERHRKVEMIKNFERASKRRLTFSFGGILAAACLTGFFVLFAINQPQNPEDVPIRSSMESVQQLIDVGDYKAALNVVERELGLADSLLNTLKCSNSNDDDETLYEIEVKENRIGELRRQRDALKKKIKE